MISASIPFPVSATVSLTYEPGRTSACTPEERRTSTLLVRLEGLPPSDLRSRPLNARFLITCPSCAAAGKAPDGLHFLRLPELIFQLPAFGNVDADAADELDFVVFVQNGKPVNQPVMHGVLVRHRVDGLHECLGADHLAIVGYEALR